MSKNINKTLQTIKLLLTQIENKIDREEFRKDLNIAIEDKNYDNVKRICDLVYNYITDRNTILKTSYSFNKNNEVLTFEKATLNFLNELCIDLSSIPNLPEYYTNVERSCFVSEDKNNLEKTTSVQTIIKKGMIIASADPQLGKTLFTICLAIKTMLAGRTPIIVTRSLNGDINKLVKDIENLAIKFSSYMNKNSITDKKFDITTIRCDKIGNKIELEMLIKSIDKEYPRIVVSLGNESQLSKIYEVVKDKPSTYDLLIDEIDYVDYGVNSKTAKVLTFLKEGAYQPFGITATALDAICSEKELKTSNMIRLKRPYNYRGFIDFQVKLLKKDKDTCGISVVKTYEEILECDKNMKPFLEWFSKRIADWSWINHKHYPRICLIKNSQIIDNQNRMYEGILENHESKFAIIVYNGEGIRMNYNGMKTCIISGKTVSPDEYVEISIPDALQYLKDNGGEKKFPRIIIISGKLAGRCISYVSRDYDWHLTDMYYIPAKSTPIPEMIQSVGRLCGLNRGKAPNLVLHSTLKVSEALYNGFNFTNELISRAIASPLMENGEELDFKDSLFSVPMNNKKFPKGRNVTSKIKVAKSKFNLTKKEDGGITLNKYKYELYNKENKEIEKKNEDEFTESINQIGETEYNRLNIIFAKWSKDESTKISRFMQNLDPVKIYTEKEIKYLCKESQVILSELQVYKRNNASGYGIILQKNDSSYRLHPCLVKEFNKYF